VDFAFDLLGRFAADGTLPARDLADHIVPALLGRTKAAALRALALIEAAAQTQPDDVVS